MINAPFHITRTSSADFAEIMEIQKKAFLSEAELYHNFNIQPLTQTLEDMIEECKDKVVLKAVIDGKIVGSVRAKLDEDNCWVNKLIVLPEYQRKGIGKSLLFNIETFFPRAKKFILATGSNSKSNIKLYEKIGYKIVSKENFSDGVEAVIMEKLAYPSTRT
ncbi:MAG TPA: GNAT family N-acetyltransferase [Prolixibacteraceae bacterium]|nr:GNAT family N-acetyltransferase [Prolixibacteraceae bacterium]